MKAQNLFMYKRTALVCLGILILVISLSLYYLNRHTVSTDNAYVRTDIVPVTSRLSGIVNDYQVEDYQVVKAGQVLIQLDTTSLELRKSQQQALIRSLDAQLANVSIRTSTQHISIEQHQALLAQSDIELKKINKQLKRSEALLASGDLSKEQYDNVCAGVELAMAQQRERRLALKYARMQINVMETELAKIHALCDQAQAVLSQIDNDLDESIIRAPLNGVIGKRMVQKGQYITQGSPVLFLLPEQRVWVIANIKETKINQIVTGQPVDITIDALTHIRWTGEVINIAPSTRSEFSPVPPRNATGHFTRVTQTVPVKIQIQPNIYSNHLKSGMSAQVVVHTKGIPDTGTP